MHTGEHEAPVASAMSGNTDRNTDWFTVCAWLSGSRPSPVKEEEEEGEEDPEDPGDPGPGPGAGPGR